MVFVNVNFDFLLNTCGGFRGDKTGHQSDFFLQFPLVGRLEFSHLRSESTSRLTESYNSKSN